MLFLFFVSIHSCRSAVADTFADLARALDGQGLPWFVFGARAVAVRGAARATQDIDVTVEVERRPASGGSDRRRRCRISLKSSSGDIQPRHS